MSDPTYQPAGANFLASPVEVGASDGAGHVVPASAVAPLPIAPAPGGIAYGITPVVSASAESSHVFKAAPGALYSIRYTNLAAVAGYLVTLNATSVPATNASIAPIDCVPVSQGPDVVEIDYSPGPPDAYSTGIVALFSTSATNYTPGGGSGLFKGRVQ